VDSLVVRTPSFGEGDCLGIGCAGIPGTYGDDEL